jgi:hypothetical protein
MFVGALLIGFPSWQSTLAGTIICLAVILSGGFARLPEPAEKFTVGKHRPA